VRLRLLRREADRVSVVALHMLQIKNDTEKQPCDVFFFSFLLPEGHTS
jgi:hypothetical protein